MVFIRISTQPGISAQHEWAPILKAEKFNKRPLPPRLPPTETQTSGPSHPKNIEKVLIRDVPEDGVFFRVF